MKKRLLAVGDSTEIEIVFSSGSRRGRFSKSPRLYTSDPSVTETRLRLKGEIIEKGDPMLNALMDFEPFGLDIIIGEEEKNTYEIEVTNVSEEELSMDLVSTSYSYFDVKLPGKVKPGKSDKIEIELLNPEAHGTQGFNKSFTIELSDSASTRFTIPVTYQEEKKQATVSHSSRSRGSAGSTVLKSSGQQTKTGNTIHVIDAGTNKSHTAKKE